MCGICGEFDASGAVVNERVIDRMCRELVHRGPDDQGIHTAPFIGLGQRRLSIIDLSKNAAPPLPNEDESIWVVFNGEIYNFRELRDELQARGHKFRSGTDTEVIVHLYEEFGSRCVDRLRGMFALAIWDANKRTLFAARDRLGKKPFYYAKTAHGLVFASELAALTVHPDVSIQPDFVAIDAYLSHQYVASPRTAFAGMCKLPPGHFLVCAENGSVNVERYWSPPEVQPQDVLPLDDLEGATLSLLDECVRIRMIADVPLGAFLSGGIDSGLVVALMAQASSAPVKTFSIGLEDESSELPFARQVAARYGTDHHEFIVRPDALEVLPTLVRHYGEPFADSSALPTYYVSKLSREHVTVALTGDGGDESFCGYNHYRDAMRWSAFDHFPLLLRRPLCHGVERLLDLFPYGNQKARAARAVHMAGAQLPERYRLHMSLLKPQEKRASYTDHFRSLLTPTRDACEELAVPWTRAMDGWDWMMRHDQQHYLPDCLMVKTDRASMANGLEVRCPFLDHHFVEHAARIPSGLKRDRSGGKVLLRKIARRLLPPAVVDKPKTGFSIPLGRWFREDLAGFLRATLLESRSLKRGLFHPEFLKRLVDEHTAGRRDWSNRLWALLCLELWFREFID